MPIDTATISAIILAMNGFGKLVISVQQLIQIAQSPPDDPAVTYLIKQLEEKNRQQDIEANELRAEKYKIN